MSDVARQKLEQDRREARDWFRHNGRKLPSTYAGLPPSPDRLRQLHGQKVQHAQPEALDQAISKRPAQREKVEAKIADTDAAVEARRARQRALRPTSMGESEESGRRRPGRRERAEES